MQHTVCILAAGKGARMGPLGEVVNKALLPYGEKAIISHIIEQFPADTRFVVALGYKADQVRDYVALAHPQGHFTFAMVDNFDGEGSGPGRSLLACRQHLEGPFFFSPCDSLVPGLPSVLNGDMPAGDWVAVGAQPMANAQAYCNMAISDGRVTDIKDKTAVDTRYRPFTGLMFIQSFADFWDALSDTECIGGEHQVSSGLRAAFRAGRLFGLEVDWQDLGTEDLYTTANAKNHDFDFSKSDEFFYRLGDTIIKFFDSIEIVEKRVAKARLKPDIFPSGINRHGQFYGYRLVPGRTLYEVNNQEIMRKLLVWLDDQVWTQEAVETAELKDLCHRFYHDKTLARLKKFAQKYPGYQEPRFVFNERVEPLETLLTKIPWGDLEQGVASFIHGDLQFDNIIFSDAGSFALIDWRQDFAGEMAFGDLYYDLAKMLGGIWLNYLKIKKGDFSVVVGQDDISASLPRDDQMADAERVFTDFLREKGYDARRVHILVGLIYLNMSPLHEAPFDVLLHALGRWNLQKALA